MIRMAEDLPFGGINNSGCGRERASLSIHECVNKKAGALLADSSACLVVGKPWFRNQLHPHF